MCYNYVKGSLAMIHDSGCGQYHNIMEQLGADEVAATAFQLVQVRIRQTEHESISIAYSEVSLARGGSC